MRKIKILGEEMEVPMNTDEAFDVVDDWFAMWKKVVKKFLKSIYYSVVGWLFWLSFLTYIWYDIIFMKYGFEKTIILMGVFLLAIIYKRVTAIQKAIEGV